MTDDLDAAKARFSSEPPHVARPLRVRCGRATSVPAGFHGTWLILARAPPNARIIASQDLASLPARNAVFVGPELTVGKHLSISCSGAESLTIADVIDAGRPG